ncbi:MAG: Ig-like domain-containing protein [Bacteroidaceae bacterium]|nr:Ig-like domain-containing protein [Bacteroidaceae bacterium]
MKLLFKHNRDVCRRQSPRGSAFRAQSLFLPFFLFTAFIFICACANIGSPDGGPYDERPPRVLASSPNNQATGADKKKITILFDEYVKIENASEKVVVSPPQVEAPNIRAVGKTVRIDLFDSLQPNTTYTVDFSDAIVDNNEGNPMGNYTYSFSTGDAIDTMEVSGYVLNAEDLEPIKGILVGLYAVNDDGIVPDSFFRTKSFERVSRTNGSGRFVIKGVARDRRYRAFALQDVDGNFQFTQKSEVVAFDTNYFETSCGPDIRLDTIWADSVHYDSITPVHYTHFYPDNIVLRAFKEAGQDRHLLKTQRDVPEQFTAFFTAPSDSLPRIQGLNFEGDGGFIAEPSAHGDTVTYWIPDTTLAYQDTLTMVFSYLDTDTLHQLVWKSDTLDFVPKTTREKQLKELAKKNEEWEKEQKKKRKKDPLLPPEENPNLITWLTIECKPAGSLDPNQVPTFTFSEPIAPIDTSAVHFKIKVDSLWEDAPFRFEPVEGSPRRYQLFAEWDLEQQYSFEIDSAAVRGLLGHTNKPFKQDFRIPKEDTYGALFIECIGADSTAIVQLMNSSDKPVRTERANARGRADFFYLKPGDYYLRCFIDSNGDGIWTTGDFDSGTAPEETFYFPQPLTVKAQWEIDQQWDIRGIETYKQKPAKLTKQKADKKKDPRQRNKEREAAMERESRKRTQKASNAK